MAGFQTFINGTSFDVLNAMSFTYVIDVIDTSGAGSRSYPSQSMNYSAYLLNNFSATTYQARNYSVTVSGNTVSWDVPNAVKIVVFAVPKQGADTGYGGFSYYDYPGGQRTIKLAPDFVPFNLVQVIDIGAGPGDLETVVPLNKGMVAFHRALNMSINQYDQIVWEQVSGNGRHVIRVTNNPYGGRLYVFSDMLLNIPAGGFYMYRDGQMVWHSNCLPLNLRQMPGGDIDSDSPLAVASNVSANLFLRQDPQYPTGYENRQCAAAGYVNGRWRATIAATFSSRYISDPREGESIRPWAVGGYPGYIETTVYDDYYRAALGV
ncbi:hypothetical protein AC791_15360 [Klebsiella sp. RIT-PI-d]|uniref:hypothetical protein n=1 Tax=Klebsiella sp. RIT-PI-d TaxID=1681196 RepID=UPI00067663F7|nr:hypothetical protein [Klebsiella sp. RIT-PI-d]KNC09988.1 hypothetical protein AC791_15360 [Klebsiella sp. RIT-PI-d]